MPQTEKPKRPTLYLPVVSGDPLGRAPRPVFGSPEVAPYGAVGLGVTIPERRSDDPHSVENTEGKTEGNKGVYRLSRTEPLPLVDSIAHHDAD
jgi:hypothetical protein